MNNKHIEAINWNRIEDKVDEATWRKLTEQFWLDTRIPVAEDLSSWRTLTPSERDLINYVFGGLTLLDTLQSTDGVRVLFEDARTPQEEAVLNNIQFMECLTQEAKVVTPRGLLSVKDIKKGDVVLQYNEDGSTEFATVRAVSSHTPEAIHQFDSTKFTLKTSPGHRMYLEEKLKKINSCKEWRPNVVEAKDFSSLPKTYHRRNVLMGRQFKSSNNTELTNLERFLIAFQADGTLPKTRYEKESIKRITLSIGFQKMQKIERFRELRHQLEQDGNVKFTITEKEDLLRNGYAFYLTGDKTYINKLGLTPEKNFDEMFNLADFSMAKARAFINELSYWDSHRAVFNGDDVITYYSSNKRNVDFVSAVCALASYPFKVNSNNKAEYDTGYQLRITQSESSYYLSLSGEIEETILTPEPVYGIEVPSTYLVVVTDKGPVITGNCVHAKSYSTIFSTFNTPAEIDKIFDWVKENPFLQYKASKVEEVYRTGSPLQRKAASVLLESFLFYSGFYTPLRFLGESRMTNTAEIIKLIIRDESVHGTYIGYKFKLAFNELSKEEQNELSEWIYELAYDLYENETKYTSELYGEIGWVKEVNVFLEYNLNKALSNLGLGQMFPTTPDDVDPIVMNGLSTTTSNHDFFSQVGNGYLLGQVESTKKSDFDLLTSLVD